jgi:hypothetical protein
MDGTEIARRLWELLNEQDCDDVCPNGGDAIERVRRGDLIPVTRTMLAQIADALGKCCDGSTCPLDNTEKPATQRIVESINNKGESMDPLEKARKYLRLTEGSEEGKPEGTPVEYIEERMKKVHLKGVSTVDDCMAGIESLEARLDDAATNDLDPRALLTELTDLRLLLGKLHRPCNEDESNGEKEIH